MSARTEFLKGWIEAEKKTVGSKKIAHSPKAGYESTDAAPRLELAPPPALVPFADMDYWYLTKDMPWTLPGTATVINVPNGFTTDFATIPSLFWTWMPRVGRYGLPALVHDWLYWDQRFSRDHADEVFGTALQELEVTAWRRFLIIRCVRWFGQKYWDENSVAKAKGEGRVLKLFPDDARVTWDQWRVKPGVFI